MNKGNFITGYERITKCKDACDSTCYLETIKTLIKWAGFYYKKLKYFALFYCKINFRSIRSWKSWEIKQDSTNCNWCYEKALFFDLISKHYKSKGLYFIDCLCAMTLSNLLEYWLFENVNLVLLSISRVLGTKRQWMTVFSEKSIE